MNAETETVAKSQLPGAAIDGSKIKKNREDKKFTQLYLATLVGVTTETISRWENNRYPSIKLENAEKVAEALDIGLAEILRGPVSAEIIEEVPALPVRRHRKWFLVGALVGVALLVAGFYFVWGSPPFIPERQLPRFCAPGEIVPVQIKITRIGAETEGFIIKECLPPGWRLVASSPPAAAGQASGEKIKWFIPRGNGSATVSYTVRVSHAAQLNSMAKFSGTIAAHPERLKRAESVGGDSVVSVKGIHWADRNGDGRIDDSEIVPSHYIAEEMRGLGMDLKDLEPYWGSKGYRWDRSEQKFLSN